MWPSLQVFHDSTRSKRRFGRQLHPSNCRDLFRIPNGRGYSSSLVTEGCCSVAIPGTDTPRQASRHEGHPWRGPWLRGTRGHSTRSTRLRQTVPPCLPMYERQAERRRNRGRQRDRRERPASPRFLHQSPQATFPVAGSDQSHLADLRQARDESRFRASVVSRCTPPLVRARRVSVGRYRCCRGTYSASASLDRRPADVTSRATPTTRSEVGGTAAGEFGCVVWTTMDCPTASLPGHNRRAAASPMIVTGSVP